MVNLGFWKNLKKPIMTLAPMDDVTDVAFRFMFAKYGKPDVLFTEFVSADGLATKDGKKNLAVKLGYSPKERPIVAQIFGSKPKNFYKATKLIKELGFDGIDINAGCPEKNVLKSGAGSALLKNLDLLGKIIKATKEGAEHLPVSVKTRTGFYKDTTEEIVEHILGFEPAVLTLHCRTTKELSKVPANWKAINKAVRIRNKLKSKTLILGNGDVASLEHAKQLIKETRCDGVMFGRAVFGQPWFFSGNTDPSINTKLEIMIEHTKLFETKFKGRNFSVMKKHFKAYITGFKGAKELRTQLMTTNSSKQVEEIANKFLRQNLSTKLDK